MLGALKDVEAGLGGAEESEDLFGYRSDFAIAGFEVEE
jgi:hypothetical protein